MFLNKPIFCDTDCLSSFLDVERTDLLKSIFSKIFISSIVKEEFEALPNDHHILQGLNRLIQEEFIEVEDMEVTSPEYELYSDFLEDDEDGGEGELSVIALTIIKNGILASNNFKDVCSYVKQYRLEHITTSRIFVKCYDEQHISWDEANTIWNLMKNEKQIRLPEETFEIYYNKDDLMCYSR